MTMLRTNEATHRSLKELSQLTGLPMQTVLDRAVTAYRRTIFLENLNDDFAALSADPQAWKEEQEERALFEQTLADGLTDEERK